MAEARAAVAALEQDTGARVDPFRAYSVKLSIDGVNEGHFTRCSAPDVGPRPPDAQARCALPPEALGDLTLRHGVTRSSELWRWFLASMNGAPLRKNVSVLLLASDGRTERRRWDLGEAWPKTWRASPLDELGQQIAIDSLTLVFGAISRG
ncbi:phage tail protein [Myxococcus sp. K15C18031901]|uniref:phage tail protein n=1 Tax=Myxococcus dinghuensis TaxID=2906761 RepID=UPI0020A7A292|nr:phage tail protein [Myxococcus dinghuensis]MCP3104374.1 phage tail protein [Myxococcus dinghuensis]